MGQRQLANATEHSGDSELTEVTDENGKYCWIGETELSTAQKEAARAQRALRAIIARINGDYDEADPKSLGPVSDNLSADVLRFAETGLPAKEETPAPALTGKQAYEEDVRRMPTYHDGTPRRPWERLDEVTQWSWNRNPTPRNWKKQENMP